MQISLIFLRTIQHDKSFSNADISPNKDLSPGNYCIVFSQAFSYIYPVYICESMQRPATNTFVACSYMFWPTHHAYCPCRSTYPPISCRIIISVLSLIIVLMLMQIIHVLLYYYDMTTIHNIDLCLDWSVSRQYRIFQVVRINLLGWING